MKAGWARRMPSHRSALGGRLLALERFLRSECGMSLAEWLERRARGEHRLRAALLAAITLLLAALPAHAAGFRLSGGSIGQPPGAGDAPTANIVASRTNCAAPCGVHFDGRGSTDPQYTTDAQRRAGLTYAWDFGDPGAGEWAYGIPDQSKNVDTEFAAIHVYDSPGSYTARLIVTDATGRKSAAATQLITVTSTDSAFPSTQTVCIAANSTPVQGVGGCPSGAAVVNATSAYGSADFDQSFNVGCDADGTGTTDKRCLFKRGDSFSGSTVSWSPNANVMVAAYGTGADPQITCAGGCFIGPENPTTDRFIVQGIKWIGDSADPNFFLGRDESGGAGQFPLQHILINGGDFSLFSINFYVYTGGGADGGPYDPDVPSTCHNDILIIGAVVHDDAGTSNSTFFEAEKSGILGSSFAQKPTDEHVIRTGHLKASILGHSDLGDFGTGTGCGSIRHILKWHNSETAQTSEHNIDGIVVANHFRACSVNQIEIDIGTQDSTQTNQAVVNSVFARNWLDAGANDQSPTLLKITTGPNVLRDNLCDMSAATSSGTIRCISAQRQTAGMLVDPDDLTITGTTCYTSTATPSSQTCITLSSDVNNATVQNTLVYDPGASITLLSDSGVGTTTCGSCNVEVASTPFVSSSPVAFADFELSATSAARDVGVITPAASIAYNGVTKPETTTEANLDVGAYQRNVGLALGQNLDRIAPDRVCCMFADRMKEASGVSAETPGGVWTQVDGSLPSFDSNGYPISVVSGTNRVQLVLIDPVLAEYPSGSYSLQITGTSSVVLTGDATGTYNAGTSAVTVTPSASGITLRVESGSPTNIKFIAPGYTSSDVFTTEFLNLFTGIGTIRFGPALARTNWTTGAPEWDAWSERTLTTYVTQAGFTGPAVEHQIDLCNAVDADCWFVFPHSFTDSMASSWATLAHSNLESGRKVILEVSNEIWNGGFDQGDEMCRDGDALWSDLDTGLNCSTQNDVEERTYKARFTAKRAAALKQAFLDAFTDDSRVKLVLAGQSGQSGSTHYNELLLDAFSQSSIGGVSVNPNGLTPDYYAGAPYFGGGFCADYSASLSTLSVAQGVSILQYDYLPDAIARVTTDDAVRDAFNASKGWAMKLATYEVAPGIEDTGQTGCDALVFDMVRHAGMQPLMARTLRDLAAAGVDGPIVNFLLMGALGDDDGIDSHVYSTVEKARTATECADSPKCSGIRDVNR